MKYSLANDNQFEPLVCKESLMAQLMSTHDRLVRLEVSRLMIPFDDESNMMDCMFLRQAAKLKGPRGPREDFNNGLAQIKNLYRYDYAVMVDSVPNIIKGVTGISMASAHFGVFVRFQRPDGTYLIISLFEITPDHDGIHVTKCLQALK